MPFYNMFWINVTGMTVTWFKLYIVLYFTVC